MARYVITQTMICSACAEQRAKRVAAEMRKQGLDVIYGAANKWPENDTEFTEAFYDALDIVDRGRHTPS